MELRPFRETDLPELLALQHALAPARRRFTPDALRAELTDGARREGRSVTVAAEGGTVRGFLGWVAGADGEFFGAPFVAADATAAGLLADRLLAESGGARWIRVSSYPAEPAKAAALAARGFRPLFEFVDFELRPEPSAEPGLPEGVREEPIQRLSAQEYRDLHNEAFQGVDNSPRIDDAQAAETLASDLFHRAYSLAWRDRDGPVAFTLARATGELDAIGVLARAQQRGYGTRLFRRVLARMAADGRERCFTVVSSRNEGSLRLHRRLGIPEVERRTVWERRK